MSDNPCNSCGVDVLDWEACKNCKKYLNWRKDLNLTISMEEILG